MFPAKTSESRCLFPSDAVKYQLASANTWFLESTILSKMQERWIECPATIALQTAASPVPGFAALPFLFRFIGEVEFGFLVYDKRADEAIRGSGTRDVHGYRQNACYTLLQVENVG
jgi:hypothetical protein